MRTRILAVALIALPCALGAHLTALLLGALAVIVVTVHLLPVIAPLILVSVALALSARIILTIRQTGFIRARSFA